MSRIRDFKPTITVALAVGLATNVVANLFSAISLRPLQNDGAAWFYFILRDGWFYWPEQQLDRLFNVIWQAPAVALVKLAGTRDWLSLELLAFMLPYCLNPFLSLAFSFWICRKARVPWLFVFPLASYATATLVAHGYAVGEVPCALSVFWPLFLIVLLRPFGPLGYWSSVLALSLALVNSHAWAIPLFGVLLVPTLAPLWTRAQRPLGETLAQAAIFSAAAGWLVYLGAFLYYTTAEPFRHYAFNRPWGFFPKLALIGALVFALLAAWGGPGTSRGRRALWVALGTASMGAFIWLGLALNGDVMQARGTVVSYIGRLPAVPVACVVALSLWIVHSRVSRADWEKERRWRFAAASLVPMLLVGASYNLAQTLNWRESISLLLAAMEREGRPCIVLSDQEHRAIFIDRGNEPIGLSLPALSMWIQGTRAPAQVVIRESYEHKMLKLDFCATLAKGIMSHWPGGSDDLRHGRHLTFERIIEGLAR